MAAIIKYHRLASLTSRNLFSHSSGGGNSEIKANKILGTDFYPSFSVFSHGGKKASSLVSLSIKPLFQLQGPQLNFITSQWSNLQISLHWGLGIWYMNEGLHKHSVCYTCFLLLPWYLQNQMFQIYAKQNVGASTSLGIWIAEWKGASPQFCQAVWHKQNPGCSEALKFQGGLLLQLRPASSKTWRKETPKWKRIKE